MAAHRRRERELAVGKGSGAAPAVQDGTGLAVLALWAALADRAVAPVDVSSFVKNRDPQARLVTELKGCEDAGRTRSNDHDIIVIMHHRCSLKTLQRWNVQTLTVAKSPTTSGLARR